MTTKTSPAKYKVGDDMVHGLQQQQAVRHGIRTIRPPVNAMETGRNVRKEVPNGSADTANRVHSVQMGRNDREALELVPGQQQRAEEVPANVNNTGSLPFSPKRRPTGGNFIYFCKIRGNLRLKHEIHAI